MKRHERLFGSTLGLFCGVAALHTTPAHAEDASAAETAAARTLAVEGLKLAQSGNCSEAAAKLERAEKLYHSPVVASRLGECFISLGRLVAGTEILRKVLREPQQGEATPALSKALERAQRALDAAKPRIAGLTVKVAAVQEMSVKIDGNAVPAALVDTEIPTDPGEHAIDVSAPGFLRSSTHVSVVEGEKKSVTVTLSRDPNAAVAAAASTTNGAKQPSAAVAAAPSQDTHAAVAQAAPAPRPANHTASYVAFGIGGVALATGGVLGYLTLKRHQDLKEQCPNDTCTSSQQRDLDSAKRLGNFSTVAFAVGGAGLALGTVLLFTTGGNDADHALASEKPRFAGVSRPRLAIGPTQVQLGADF
ncbi:MAG TPA: PEGA domain-containing protein [Polyangiaceae bacterium]|nr:PEGA domain-containing protein [Polyangiaceae bacterium]